MAPHELNVFGGRASRTGNDRYGCCFVPHRIWAESCNLAGFGSLSLWLSGHPARWLGTAASRRFAKPEGACLTVGWVQPLFSASSFQPGCRPRGGGVTEMKLNTAARPTRRRVGGLGRAHGSLVKIFPVKQRHKPAFCAPLVAVTMTALARCLRGSFCPLSMCPLIRHSTQPPPNKPQFLEKFSLSSPQSKDKIMSLFLYNLYMYILYLHINVIY